MYAMGIKTHTMIDIDRDSNHSWCMYRLTDNMKHISYYIKNINRYYDNNRYHIRASNLSLIINIHLNMMSMN